MVQQLILAGFFSVLLPPLALVIGLAQGVPWGAFVVFVAASPVTRFLFGVYKPRDVEVSAVLRPLLNALPVVYAVVCLTCLVASAALMGKGLADSGWSSVGFGLSLWTVMVFGTFPAHEMLHSRKKWSIGVGAFLSGVCGYPVQGLEHAVHHMRGGNTRLAEWARKDETVWGFMGRRLPMVVKTAVERDRSLRQSGQWAPGTTPLTIGMLGLAAGVMTFWAFGGLAGLVVYLVSAASVFVSMQIMTFVQHWGLGDDEFDRARERELAWEDDCLMQAWMTMGNSFHMAHHREPDAAYYYLQPSSGAPRQPGCYVAMLVICVVPEMWRRLMLPVLSGFKTDQPIVCDPGRRVLCISPTRFIQHDPLPAPRNEQRKTS